jgi:hypothetical protein
MKFRFIAVLLLCGGLGASAWAQCGGGIPSAGNPGCIPPDRSNSPYYQGGTGSTPLPPPAIWADRWGAIAYDSKANTYGISVNQDDKAKAKKAAFSDCGTANCQIVLSYRNQCAALAGAVGRMGYAGGPELNEAEASAVAKCAETGTSSCQILHSACSMPVRIQ